MKPPISFAALKAFSAKFIGTYGTYVGTKFLAEKALGATKTPEQKEQQKLQQASLTKARKNTPSPD